MHISKEFIILSSSFIGTNIKYCNKTGVTILEEKTGRTHKTFFLRVSDAIMEKWYYTTEVGSEK